MQDPIAARLRQASGLQQGVADTVSSAVMQALIEQLPRQDRTAFARRLPVGVPSPLGSAKLPSESAQPFYERVSMLAGLPLGHAVEAAQVVCEALDELLDRDARAWLAARLPRPIDELLTRRGLLPHVPEVPHVTHLPATLAEGRPGGTHPLSEAREDDRTSTR